MNKIGQLRSSSIAQLGDINYLTELTSGLEEEKVSDYVIFENPTLSFQNSAYFRKGISYYATFTLSMSKSEQMTIDGTYYEVNYTILIESPDGTNQQALKTVHIGADTLKSAIADNKGKITFTNDVAFVPNQENTYNKILIKIERNYKDFLVVNTNLARVCGRSITVSGSYVKMSDMFNVISQSSLTRIGIQGKPGLIFTINGQAIKLGRSGKYELNDSDILIKQLSFIPIELDGNNSFIVDYMYKE